VPNFPLYKKAKVASLVPYASNARTHTPEQVAQIAASIREFGFLAPIVTDGEDGIVAGHGRVLAAELIGLTEVPCIDAGHLTPAQKRAYVLADNKIALNAGWDEGLLKVEIAELAASDFDLSLTGFSDLELSGILADKTSGLTDPDDAPPVQAEAVSELGCVWLLGAHRLVCGDCTDAQVVEKCLGSIKPHLMVTDPPYGVEYDPNWRVDAAATGNIKYGATRVGLVDNDDRADWSVVWTLFPGDVAYVWHASAKIEVGQHVRDAGFDLRSQIIWRKPHLQISRGHYHWQHESCWYCVRKGKSAGWTGDRKQTTVWDIAFVQGGKDATLHGTQKPVECMKRPIENNSSPGQAVYDPFVGSGTTIIAAEQTGRVCHAIELSPNYVDVCVRRWEAFTGKDATLESTGRTFKELSGKPLAQAV